MMKRIAAVLLILSAMLVFTACGKTADDNASAQSSPNASASMPGQTENTDDGSADVEEQYVEKELDIPAPSENDLEALGLDGVVAK